MRWLLTMTCSLAFAFGPALQCVQANDDKPGDVSEILKAEDFWSTTGKQNGRTWTDSEKRQLEELKTTSKDGVIRLRANKVLVDLAGNSRIDGYEDAVTDCFRYLEKQLGSAPVKQLCAEVGFTHYGIGTGTNGVFLIEHVDGNPKGFNGGLNLTWDREKKTVTGVKSWGKIVAE
ncbi:MAG: hypothetical protein K8U03_07110 [Planctomycetia bacterium]|nr:hypothetical protein [Planctomycetia bacterium]